MSKVTCIDVSCWQTNVDYNKVKSAGIEAVIIRSGYGRELSQKDSQFETHYKNAKAAGLKVGTYWYSYADSVADAKKEAATCLACIKGKSFDMPVYYDLEESSQTKLGKTTLTEIAKAFCEAIKASGYKAGVYSNLNWFNNYLDYDALKKSYSIWLAQYYTSNGKDCDIWQNSSTGKINGISGNVDTNIIFNRNVFSTSNNNNTTSDKSTITEAQLRQKVANVMLGWLGSVEGDERHAEILKIYNSQNPLPVGYKMQLHDAWCAATVSAAWLKVGIAKYTGTECGCGRFIDVAKKLGVWVENDAYVPKLGDAVMYDWDDSGIGDDTSGASHIGIVTTAGSKSFTVTEGNTGNGVVGQRTMQVNGKYIRGFIAPNYADIANKVSGTVTPDKPSKPSKPNKPSATPDVTYKVRAGGRWLPAVKNLEDYAGITGKAITDVAIKVSKGSVKYRVHIKGGFWLPYVTGYDTSDYNNGYAGNGKEIDAIEVYYSTPSDLAKTNGYYKAKYKVSPVNKGYYDWQYDNEKTNGQDGYAGLFGKSIDRLQIVLSK